MTPLLRTAVFVVVAVVLAAAAWLTRPAPPQLARFSDQGDQFYPEFEDPLLAASLEVIDYDESAGAARPFKVQVSEGRWTIPSHYDYPADGEDRLARTASAIIDLRKDVVQSDRAQDHEALGVIDPLDDTTPTLRGRGQRVTLRDAAGAVLADFIIGRPVEGKGGFRYVRLPEKKRTYAVKVDVDLSTRFADWIDTDLLDLDASDITTIEVNDYSIDETSGTVVQAGLARLDKSESGAWQVQSVPEGQMVDATKVSTMTTALAGLTITGVRPKPASLSSDLRARQGLNIDLPTQLSLQSKGFFVSPDGRLLSNEGEVSLGTAAGVRYTLRFGEIIYGEGLEVSAGSADESETSEDASPSPGQAENRYLFITASFDESLLPPKPEPPAVAPNETPDDEDRAEAIEEHEEQVAEWEEQAAAGRAEAARLNDRFAPWYYVISASDFRSIRPAAADLLKPIEAPAPGSAGN